VLTTMYRKPVLSWCSTSGLPLGYCIVAVVVGYWCPLAYTLRELLCVLRPYGRLSRAPKGVYVGYGASGASKGGLYGPYGPIWGPQGLRTPKTINPNPLTPCIRARARVRKKTVPFGPPFGALNTVISI
jgi:hypothetical protein